MKKWIYLNSAFVAEEEGVLHHRDLSVQRGYGIFDFFRLVGTKPLFLNNHLSRLRASADGLYLELPIAETAMVFIISELIDRNGLTNTGIRITLTGGYSSDGFSPAAPNLIIAPASFKPSTSHSIRLLPHAYQRQLSELKTIDYLNAIWLQPQLKQQGFDDALYHANSWITECPRSNFFLVTGDGVLATPNEGMLKGITRNKVLELARTFMQVEERPVHLDELSSAKEVFVTSTTKRLLSVSQVGDTLLPETSIAARLTKMFEAAFVNP